MCEENFLGALNLILPKTWKCVDCKHLHIVACLRSRVGINGLDSTHQRAWAAPRSFLVIDIFSEQ